MIFLTFSYLFKDIDRTLKYHSYYSMKINLFFLSELKSFQICAVNTTNNNSTFDRKNK